MAFCKNCGQQLIDGAKFCGSCGTPVAAAEAQPQQSAAAPQAQMPEAPVYAAPQEPMQPEPTYAAPQSVSSEDAPPAEQYPQDAYQPQSSYQYPQDAYQPQSSYQYPQDGYQPQSSYQYPQDGYGYGYGVGGYVPPEQPPKKKSKKGLVIGIIAAAVVIIGAVAAFLLLRGGSSDFVGYWECSGADFGDGEIIDDVFGTEASEMYAFALRDDNTFTMTVMGLESVSGTWTSDKKSVTLTADGDTITLPYEHGKLVMDFSEDGLEFTIYFELESKKIPDDLGTSVYEPNDWPSLAETDPPSISVDIPNEPAEPDDVPAADNLGDELYCSFGDFSYEILGGEPCTGDDGENCFRVYFRFTNNSDTHYSAGVRWFTAYQDGEELETYWLMDSSDEDDYYYSDVMPGISIICSRVYQLNNSSPLDFYISEYWDISDGEPYAFCRFDVTADTADGLTNSFPAVSDPTWASSMTDEVTWDNLYVYIDSAELASSWDGTDDLIRVYFDWVNYYDDGSGSSSFYMETTLYAFQDGVELNWGSASDSLDSEMDIYEDYAVGDGGTVCHCWELLSRSPIVVLVVNWRTDECIGCTFYFN